MILQHSSELAIRAVLFLAQQAPGKLSPVHEIAAEIGVSKTYLAKVTQRLVSTGLVRSFRGPGKGLELGRAPGNISLASVVRAAQGALDSDSCVLGRGVCSDEHPCALHSEWLPLRMRISELLERTTLADLIRPGEQLDKAIISIDSIVSDEKRRQR
jgi:Rrf2 family protein